MQVLAPAGQILSTLAEGLYAWVPWFWGSQSSEEAGEVVCYLYIFHLDFLKKVP